MLNWDDPLAAPAPKPAPRPIPAIPPQHEVTADPVALSTAEPRSVRAADPQMDLSLEDTTPHIQPSAPLPPSAMKPVNPEDKRVVNGHTDINQQVGWVERSETHLNRMTTTHEGLERVGRFLYVRNIIFDNNIDGFRYALPILRARMNEKVSASRAF